MGRGIPKWTEKKIATRMRAGFGQGELATYKPWQSVRDFSSQGTTTRIFSSKLGRAVTVFSNVERNAFFVAEFNSRFVDYWEQAAMPRDETSDIATALGVAHPVYPQTSIPIVMTLDGILSLRTPYGVERKVIDCKSSSELTNGRTQQKLAINREYARRHGYEYLLYTELSTPQAVAHNLQWIRMSVARSGDRPTQLSAPDIQRTRLLQAIRKVAASKGSRETLREFLGKFDSAWHLPAGAALRMLRELMWTHDVEFDLSTPFQRLLVGPVAALSCREVQPMVLPASTHQIDGS